MRQVLAALASAAILASAHALAAQEAPVLGSPDAPLWPAEAAPVVQAAPDQSAAPPAPEGVPVLEPAFPPQLMLSPAVRPLSDVSRMIAYLEFADGRSRQRSGNVLVFGTALPFVALGAVFLAIAAAEGFPSSADGLVIGGGASLGLGIVTVAVGIAMIVSGKHKQKKYARFIDWAAFDLQP